ncbi:CPBP family intramembrane glutamic endopeptidase [Candidatus Mycoplasma haematominutum]|uniref:CPBP family intramembrane glutamic endopeptidase n=1 Tax=Candidatus Mycoplasma haematominutum TaxID=209446 RepID=UPI0003165CA3|nr:CPBP family intramembrane glutamic endopeptidase [Candidatus Mycoplasma haematominutum]
MICSTVAFFVEPKQEAATKASVLSAVSVFWNSLAAQQQTDPVSKRWYMGKYFYTLNILYLCFIGAYFAFYFKFFKWDPAPFEYKKDNRDFLADYFLWFFCSIIYPLFEVFLLLTQQKIDQKNPSELYHFFLLLTQLSYFGVIFLYIKQSWSTLSSHFWILFRNSNGIVDKKRIQFYFTKIFYFLAADVVSSSMFLRLIEYLVPSHPAKGENQTTVETKLKSTDPGRWFISVTSTLVFAPVIEELVYRRSLLRAASFHPSVIAASAFIFGMIHMRVERETIFRLLPYAVGGAIFAWSYRKFRNIWFTIFIHFFHNFISLIFMLANW